MKYLLLALLLYAPWSCATASFALELTVADVHHPTIQLQGIRLHWQQDTQQVRIHIANMQTPQHTFSGLQLHCPKLQGLWPTVTCKNALLEIHRSPWGKQQIRLDIQHNPAQRWQLAWHNFAYAGSRLSGTFSLQDKAWQIQLGGKALKLDKAPELAPIRQTLGLTALAGQLDIDARLSGQDGAAKRIDLQGGLKQVSGNNKSGSLAFENLALGFHVSARQQQKAWRGGVKLNSAAGQMYREPIFFDFKQQPVNLVLDGALQTMPQKLQAQKIWLQAGRMLQLDGAGEFSSDALIKGRAKLKLKDLQAGYASFIQPWLIGGLFDEMRLDGQAAIDLRWRNNQLTALDAQLEHLSAQQNNNQFALQDINADLHWLNTAAAAESRLQWSGGQIAGLDFGALDMRVQANGNQFKLLHAVQVPFYQGSIEFADAIWQRTGQDAKLQLTTKIHRVSLDAMSADTDLGWPALQGSISGIMPGVQYANDSLTLDGSMQVAVFDGELRLNELVIHELSSAAPVLQTDIQIQAVNLAKLTTAFSLGNIQGGLDGKIHNLQLVGWQPNRFDAHLHSPADDPLPHRISQRAIEHLTELGQGVSGALSASLLRFFESFAYDELSIKLHQRGAQVEIDGLPHADGGYYLVKGAGLPRVDVIGHNRQVAWKTLLERIQSIQSKNQ